MLWVTTAYILASTIMLPVYGKLGDLIGRKKLFITAIAIFMAGSVIGALAHSMPQLIAGRAVQGLGGGGLLVLAQAIIADVVPARQRGKYMGIMGGVFAFSSVAGPLLGGFFTESIGWRWAFWMNLPLGLLAMLAALFFLHPGKRNQRRPRVDYTGILLLALASASLVLATTWGGSTYAWSSPIILGLFAAALAAAVGFVYIERRASEPVMPPALFRDHNFRLTTSAGLIIGVAMFGALSYMPTYLQMVTGVSATKAGLLIIPLMGSLLITSIASGQFVSRTGRYKWLPVIGSSLVVLALLLLSTMKPSMPVGLVCAFLAVMGLGLGMCMQLLVLIVQNSFPTAQVGTATAANNYFRQMGASIGASIVGSLFVSRLTSLLAQRLPGSGLAASSGNSFTPELVDKLPPALHASVVGAYSEALAPVFLYIAPVVVVAVILLTFIREKPLATKIAPSSVSE